MNASAAPRAAGSSNGPAPSRRRPWLLVAALATAALLHAATWVGIDQNAFVLWNSIHTFYFKHSYAAGPLPLALAGLLLLAALLLILKRPAWAQGPAFLAMLASFALLPRMGAMSFLKGYVHPMQLVHWAALALTWAGCLWLFVSVRARRGAPT